jgi:hypothetical protein
VPPQNEGTELRFAACSIPWCAHWELHQQGAWGPLDPDDIWATEHAVKPGVRLLSAYHLADSTTIWSITEVDWSSTCVLLPDHY